MKDGYPYARNINDIEFIVIEIDDRPDLTIIGLYRSPKIALLRLLSALCTIWDENSSSKNLVIGDFNVNWMVESERQSLYNLMIIENNYIQVISNCTTDNGTLFTNR